MIGNRIKQARTLKNYSQAWLAEEVGVSQPSVNQWESGRSEPTTNNLSRIAQCLSVSFEWLATGSGEMYLRDEVKNCASATIISDDDREIFELIKRMPKSKRKSLLIFLKSCF